MKPIFLVALFFVILNCNPSFFVRAQAKQSLTYEEKVTIRITKETDQEIILDLYLDQGLATGEIKFRPKYVSWELHDFNGDGKVDRLVYLDSLDLTEFYQGPAFWQRLKKQQIELPSAEPQLEDRGLFYRHGEQPNKFSKLNNSLLDQAFDLADEVRSYVNGAKTSVKGKNKFPLTAALRVRIQEIMMQDFSAIAAKERPKTGP